MAETRFDRHPWRTGVSLGALFLLLMAIGSEVALRIIGLGDPILYETHRDYGYRPKPNQLVRRFGGAVVRINNLGLRALEDWHSPARKVVFLGDSVTYGGSYVSTEDLFATRAVPAGWSGGSAGVNAWGVGNIHGLVVRHGFLPARIYVTVLIENDFARGFSERPRFFRTTKPFLAMAEILPHLTEHLRAYMQRTTAEAGIARQKKRETIERSVRQLSEMDSFLRDQGFVHLMYVSPSRAHLERRATLDALVAHALAQTPLRVVQLQDHPDLVNRGSTEIAALYHDGVHLSRHGHAIWSAIIGRDLDTAIRGATRPVGH